MLPQKIAFLDLETTGARSNYDRIIEVGILRVEDGKITRTLNTLINPESFIPPEIEYLTGIKSTDLENAPIFSSVAEEIIEILKDCILIAHNVRFDYGFLKSEFFRENISFTSKHLCTVKLSRKLFPQFKRHNLDSIIERYNIECKNRHRALDDAKVIFDFYTLVQSSIDPEIFENAINFGLKKPAIPINLSNTDLDQLPESPGIYTFYDKTDTILYIGKSTNIKDRVLSHFNSDINSSKEMKISSLVSRIETEVTAGELGALIKESHMIKNTLPLFNKRLRIKKELIALKTKINEKGYQTTSLMPIEKITPNDLDITNSEYILGFFKSKKQAKIYLSSITNDYILCEKLLGLELTKDACFKYRLDKCNGACINKELPLKYNMRFIEALTNFKIKPWPYNGPITIVEENTLLQIKEVFIIDKWCYLGSIKYDNLGSVDKSLRDDIIFDTDIYKILLNYLKSPNNLKKIKKLNNSETNIEEFLDN